MKFNNDKFLSMNSYDMSGDSVTSSLLTVGNGYLGVRGSYEEYSTIGVQGGYIRGLIDEIVDICLPVPTNEYLKHYYLDEERLKEFERMDCGINFADMLMVRIFIGGKQFTMWDGNLKAFRTYLDTERGVLTREVTFDDGAGNLTDIKFERFASFHSYHLLCQRVTITPKNHSLKITVLSGCDLRTKTNGQKITEVKSEEFSGNAYYAKLACKNKYKFEYALGIHSRLIVNGRDVSDFSEHDGKDIRAVSAEIEAGHGDVITLEKINCVVTERDGLGDSLEAVKQLIANETYSYGEQFIRHEREYQKKFDAVRVDIEGDDASDAVTKYCAYQTLISGCKTDGVHGIGAKGLTGEKYHQFVWWDSEIYQMPFFLYTDPVVAKNTLMYRYSVLKQAKENARLKGLGGARFAFCSSVTGEECVWKFTRHPFMQDHISADVGYAVINYYNCTLDIEFMKAYGFEILFECLKYWLSRVKQTERGFEILQVTGPDEHHPYVDNDAYTNYLVQFIASRAVVEYRENTGKFDFAKIGVDEGLAQKIEELSQKIYLPIERNGLVPQFDGYFGLLRGIESAGLGDSSMQMKYNGLYHKSQIIKQPDVMLLYSYLNLDNKLPNYCENWDYYEHMCESSSSLSYAPHAVAAMDNHRPLSFLNYFLKTSKIDIENLHGGAHEGLHSGCIAGSWLSVFRGVFGIVPTKDKLIINPNYMPLWESVTLKFMYHGVQFKICARGKSVELERVNAADKTPVSAVIFGEQREIKDKISFNI